MTKRRLVNDSSGVSLIEMAFVFPLLVALLLGAAEYGRLCYVGVEVTNAAHAGAEYGTQSRIAAQSNSIIQSVSLQEESDIQNMNVPTPLTASSVTVQQLCASTYSDTPGACSSTSSSPIEYVQVNTQVTVASLFHPYGFGGNYTLHGQALERVRQ
jgi:Flp pilus assembly protein TadG